MAFTINYFEELYREGTEQQANLQQMAYVDLPQDFFEYTTNIAVGEDFTNVTLGGISSAVQGKVGDTKKYKNVDELNKDCFEYDKKLKL